MIDEETVEKKPMKRTVRFIGLVLVLVLIGTIVFSVIDRTGLQNWNLNSAKQYVIVLLKSDMELIDNAEELIKYHPLELERIIWQRNDHVLSEPEINGLADAIRETYRLEQKYGYVFDGLSNWEVIEQAEYFVPDHKDVFEWINELQNDHELSDEEVLDIASSIWRIYFVDRRYEEMGFK